MKHAEGKGNKKTADENGDKRDVAIKFPESLYY
jgi:hypothetical protein